MPKQRNNNSNSLMNKTLNKVEWLGNRLPDPFMLFVSLAIIVILLSWLIASFDVTFSQPDKNEEIAVKSLLSSEGLRYMITSIPENFIEFKPLGIVLTIMIGIGLADKVGLIETFIKNTIMQAPRALITYAVVFTGIVSNLAADAAYVIIPPLAAMVFYHVGRHPLAGIAAGFASVGSGFTANIIVSNTDAVISGISADVMESIDASATVTPVDNYYFMLVSVIFLTVTGVLVTEKIIEPRLGTYKGGMNKELQPTRPIEKKGLRNAAFGALAYIVLLILAISWPSSPLRNNEGGMIPSPFLDSIVPIIMMFFVTVALNYGITTKKIENTKSIAHYMGQAMKDMSGFIVLVFAAAQFIAYFEWTNIGSWLAVTGADYLDQVGVKGIVMVILFVLLTALLNLFITSGAAQWALEAPVFLKMFYFLGFHPAFIQASYRIADSSTNIITPMNAYFVIVLEFVREYDSKAGIGTLMALMLPYGLIFLIVWIILLLIFILFQISFGPGIGVYL